MIELDKQHNDGAKIRVIGVGGCGGNAVNNMIANGLTGVDLIAINTDKQALDHSNAAITLQIGEMTTGGKGAGAKPEVGKKATEESEKEIKEILEGSDMIFVTAGMGGGTGTGGAPVIARIGKELDALVVAIVTEPFKWEGPKKIAYANAGIAELKEFIDAIIVIPNNKLMEVTERKMKFAEAFKMVDEILHNATRGIADMITLHGMVNVDFADVRTVMKDSGMALMGIGSAEGENRAVEATKNALNAPMLDGVSISGAQSALVNIIADEDLGFHEVDEVLSTVSAAAGEDVSIIHGVVFRDEPTDELVVTVVATGFEKNENKAEETAQISAQEEHPFNKEIPHIFRKPNTMTNPSFDQNNNSATQPAAVNTLRAAHELTACPRGEKQLKEFDEPAAFRRPIGTDSSGETVSRFETLRGNKTPEKSEINPNSYEKPTFLRKMMD